MGAFVGKLQAGKETEHGTAVAATTLVPIELKPIPVDRKVTTVPFDIGKNVDVTGKFVQGRLVEDTLSWDKGYFEILPYLLSCCLKGGITPTEQTPDKDDYLWNFEPNLDETSNAQDSLTLRRGDNVQAYIHAFTMFKNVKISGQVNQDGGESSVKIDADYFAQENVSGAFTATVIPTLNTTFMNAKLAQVYLDSLFANVGKTELTNLLRSFDLEITGNPYPQFNGSDQETFDAFGQGPISFLLNLTLVRSALTETLRAAIGQSRTVRLAINGPVINSSGKNHLFQADLYGVIEDVVPMAENDRSKTNNLDTLVLQGEYDPISGKMLVPTVSTDLASL